MQPRLEIDRVNRIVRTVYAGIVTLDDLQRGNAALRSAISSHGPCSSITDLTAVKRLMISDATLKEIAELAQAIPPGHTKVIVVPTDSIFAMSRVFQILREKSQRKTHVVRSMEEAYELLGVTSPQFCPLD